MNMILETFSEAETLTIPAFMTIREKKRKPERLSYLLTRSIRIKIQFYVYLTLIRP